GDLSTKQVGVIGLGAIGSRVARWCVALGATARGFDPFVPEARVREWGVEPAGLDRLVDESEVLFVLVLPTPSAKHLLNRERIGRLRTGALVVAVTRAHAIDMAALRERILVVSPDGERRDPRAAYDLAPGNRGTKRHPGGLVSN